MSSLNNILPDLSRFHVKPLHKYLFYIFIFLIPIQTRILLNADQAYINDYFSYHLAFFVYLADLVFVLCLIDWLIFGHKQITNRVLFTRILAYFGLILVTLLHVKRLDLGLYQTLKWLELLALLVYCWWNLNPRDLKVSLIILFLGGVLQAGIGIAQFHVQQGLNLGFLGEYVAPIGTSGLATIDVSGMKLIRAYGTMSHPNVLAGFLISVLFAGFYYVSRGTRLRWLVSCGTYLVILGIFFTFSRVGWLAAVAAITVFVIYNIWTKNRPALAGIGLIVVVSCGTILIGYKDLATARATERLSSQSVTLRSDFNGMAREIIKKYPALGVGVGNYIEAIKDTYQVLPWQHQPPHNIYLLLAAELGILGLGLFLVLIFEMIRSVWHKKTELLTFTLLTTVCIFLLMGLFDHYLVTIQQGRLIFFTTLGLLLATKNPET